MSRHSSRSRICRKSFRAAYGRTSFDVLLQRYMRRNPSLGPREVAAQVTMELQEIAQAAGRLIEEMADIVAATTGAPIRANDEELRCAVFKYLGDDLVWFARGDPRPVDRVTQFLLRLAARLLSGAPHSAALDEALRHADPGFQINVVRSTSGTCLEVTSGREKP